MIIIIILTLNYIDKPYIREFQSLFLLIFTHVRLIKNFDINTILKNPNEYKYGSIFMLGKFFHKRPSSIKSVLPVFAINRY